MSNLLQDLELGFYAVPEIQRSFVWQNRQIMSLSDSISRRYPIGTIIVWKMPHQFVSDYGDLLRPLADNITIQNAEYMVIDGQQRLTSLLLIRKGELSINGKPRVVGLYFNPLEREFKLSRGTKLDNEKSWFKVKDVLDPKTDIDDLLENKAAALSDPSIKGNKLVRKKLGELKSSFDNYQISLYQELPFSADDFLELFEQITEVIIRLNSTGTRIKLPDLILALLTARARKDCGTPFRDKVVKMLEELRRMSWEIDETVVVRTYMATSVGVTGFKDARDKLTVENGAKILEYLDNTEQCLKSTLALLQKDLGIVNSDMLKSKYLVVPLAYYVWRNSFGLGKPLSTSDLDGMRRWLALASFDGRYTGRLESQLKEDISDIKAGKSFKELEGHLTIREVTQSMLEREYEKEHLTALELSYRLNGACDWDKDAKPFFKKVCELAPNEISVHHVFPQEVLKQYFAAHPGSYSTPDPMTLIEDVANITLLSTRANESIKNSRPEEYLEELYGLDPTLLENHLVPLEKSLWKLENYEKFLQERKKLLLVAFRNLLGE